MLPYVAEQDVVAELPQLGNELVHRWFFLRHVSISSRVAVAMADLPKTRWPGQRVVCWMRAVKGALVPTPVALSQEIPEW
jgi:hypothetical protein